MNETSIGCLILACGNTLRGDDGLGPWLAAWARERFATEPAVRVIARQQWTPELAEDVAQASAVIFLDCAVVGRPGELRVARIQPETPHAGLSTHHLDPAHLVALAESFYGTRPGEALLLTVCAGSTEMGETFSTPVHNALPSACATLENEVRRVLALR